MLFVDSREPKAWQTAARLTVGADHVIVKALESADYMMLDACPDSHSLGIERKTTSDLLGSLSSGRLEDQIRRITETYTFAVLLIEGTMKMSREGGWTVVSRRVGDGRGRETQWKHAAVQALLFSLQRRYGLIVLYTAGPEETTDTIRVFHQRTEKGCFDGNRRVAQHTRRAGRPAGGDQGQRPAVAGTRRRRSVDPDSGFPAV